MNPIFVGQSKLRLIIDTACDVSGIETAKLAWRKPNGKEGATPCGVLNQEEGSLFCDVEEPSFLDMAGWWVMWPEVLFDDGRRAFGRPCRVFVGERGR